MSRGAATPATRRTTFSKAATSAQSAAESRTAAAVRGHRGIAPGLIAGVEVDSPGHGTTEAKVVGKAALHLVGLFIVVANPLVVPYKLLHHRVLVESRNYAFLLDQLLDLSKGHYACRTGTFARLARPRERAAELIAARI